MPARTALSLKKQEQGSAKGSLKEDAIFYEFFTNCAVTCSEYKIVIYYIR